MAGIALRHPGPPSWADLDVTASDWRQSSLGVGLAAMILPLANTWDVCHGVIGDEYDVLRWMQSPVGAFMAFNGGWSSVDFGTSDRYAITRGGITLAAWVRFDYEQSAYRLPLSRRASGGRINYTIEKADTHQLQVTHTKTGSDFYYYRSSQTLSQLGLIGQWALLSVSWWFGDGPMSFYLNGQPLPGSMTGSPGEYVPDEEEPDHLSLGASWLGEGEGMGSHYQGGIGPVMIWRRQLSAAEHWQLHAPQTRWSLLPVRSPARRPPPGQPPPPPTGSAYYYRHYIAGRC